MPYPSWNVGEKDPRGLLDVRRGKDYRTKTSLKCFKVTDLSSNAQVKRGISTIMLANRVEMYETDSMGKIKFYLLKHSQVLRYIIHLGDNLHFTKTITSEPSTIEQLIYIVVTRFLCFLYENW